MNNPPISPRLKNGLLLLLLLAVPLVYLSLSFNDSVWTDEAFTMVLLRQDFAGITQGTIADVHPPLYYYIAKLFTMVFGCSVPVVKVVSILPVVLTCLLVTGFFRRYFPEHFHSLAFATVFLIGFCPAAFTMNVEIRMYTWGLFFVTLSGLSAYALWARPSSKITLLVFILSGVCAAFTHYYCVVTECFIYLFLMIALLKKDLRNWKQCVVFCLATVVLYAPWLPIFVRQFSQVRTGWWLEEFALTQITDTVSYLFRGEFVTLFLLLAGVVLVGFAQLLLSRPVRPGAWFALLCMLTFAGTILVGYVLSKLIRPLYVDRYMYPACGLLFVGLAIALHQLDQRLLLRNALVALLAVNFFFSYPQAIQQEYSTGTEEFKAYAAQELTGGETLTTDFQSLTWSILPYYLPELSVAYTPEISPDLKGLFLTERSLEELQALLPQSHIQEEFTGGIDCQYNFTIYRIS